MRDMEHDFFFFCFLSFLSTKVNIFSLLSLLSQKKLHLFFGTHKIFKKKTCSFRVGFRVSDSSKKKALDFL